MTVGILTVSIMISESNSLKDKRQVVRSLVETLRQRFNVSVAEVGEQNSWRHAIIGVTCVSGDGSVADAVLNKIMDHIRSNPRVEVTDMQMEFV